MRTWFNILAICVLAVSVGACSKKSSNKSASTPNTVIPNGSCYNGNYSYNQTTNQWVDSSTGQVVNCNGLGNVGGYPQGLPNTGYNNGQYYQSNGCNYWTQYYQQQGYNVSYFPAYVGNQIMCVRSDLLQQAGMPQYAMNQYYYSQQPFYTCNWGYDCGYGNGGYGNGGYGYDYGGSGRTCLNFGGSSWGQYSVSGQLGICF